MKLERLTGIFRVRSKLIRNNPTQQIQATVVYTGKDVNRYQAFKAQLSEYKDKLSSFIDRLYQAVGPIQPDTVKAWV